MVARPFWIIGHNTNRLADVQTAVGQGANAVEIDVHEDADGKWVVSHDAPRPDAPELAAFLRSVSETARLNPRLCLVTLDCKTYNPALAETLIDLARFNWADLGGAFVRPFIISVPHRENAGFLDPIAGTLRDGEGLMIDEDDDVTKVAQRLGAAKNPCFGDGTTSLAPGPHVRPAIEHATALKAAGDGVKFTYSWTFVQLSSLSEQVEVGVDGIISDNIPGLVQLLNGRFATTVRLATAADDPFARNVPSYGLAVLTGPGGRPGEAVEITITGSVGTASKRIDASLSGRFDALSTTFVTILGQEVGEPRTIAVSSTGSSWHLESIQLLGTNQRATFDAVVAPGAAPVVRDLA
jgi:glycerophosphoryl diester phosphodiesterase